MSEHIDKLKDMLITLKLSHSVDSINEVLELATKKSLSYERFLEALLRRELNAREQKRLDQALKYAAFPEYKTLDEFDITAQQSLSERQFNQLRELTWVEQGYNLILLGPPGVGKTFLSVGLGIEAINNGYRVIFTQMNELIHSLKTQEILSSSRTKLKRITGADLVIIDDLMFMAMDKTEANLFFQLINRLYGQTSIIITSNKGPEDWGELLGDPAITTAILDRIVHKCEVINLYGDSYMMKHRESIFGNH